MTTPNIGQPIRRIDGRKKVTGAAHYAADWHPPGLCYAYGVFSTIARGTIRNVDTRDARRVPGVIDIFHHDHFPALFRVPQRGGGFNAILEASITDEHRLPFEDDKVYYAGQFVALVVADSFEHAREAAYRVHVDYAKEAPLTSLEQGVARNGTQDGGRGHQRGDAASAFEQGAHRVDAVYRTPVETHNPMEMHATTAQWRDGGLHLYEATQGVTVHRNTIARVFGLDPERVVVEAPFIGSGFGSKLFIWPHSIAAAAVSREVGRPVKLLVPRAQMFTTTGHRPQTEQRLRLATDAQGKLVSLRHESISTQAFVDNFTENCGGMSKSLYGCANVLVSHKTTRVHQGAPTSMRAPGAAPGLFALESAVDEMALAAGVDPLEFRLRNISTRDESANLPWSSNHLREAILQGADKFGWAKRDSRVGAMRDGDEVIGMGMAACSWDAMRTPARARVMLRADGTVEVTCAVQDIGTGTYTVVAQTVADLTGLGVEKIDVRLADSAMPAAPLSGGSWATASVMPAIAVATRNAISQLVSYAVAGKGAFSGAKAEDVKFVDGALVYQGKTVPFGDALRALKLGLAIGDGATGGAPEGKVSFRSFGAHFVEVRFDPAISHLRVSRVVSAIDVGKIVNPLTAKNQVEGAIVMGIGMALFEATDYDPHSGLPANNSFAEYLVPVHADQPDIDVILLDYPDLALNEFGVRGIGEIGITGLAAAVANAVYHATGKRVRDLPITLEKVMKV